MKWRIEKAAVEREYLQGALKCTIRIVSPGASIGLNCTGIRKKKNINRLKLFGQRDYCVVGNATTQEYSRDIDDQFRRRRRYNSMDSGAEPFQVDPSQTLRIDPKRLTRIPTIDRTSEQVNRI